MPNIQISSFNGGELSPYMESRSDVEKYASGCRTIENMMVTPYGTAYRRPGLEFIGKPKFDDKKARLIGFNYSTNTRFIIEAGHHYVRFWSNGTQVMDPNSPTVPLEVVSPYDETHLHEIQYQQINDIMILVHPSYPVRKLTRHADDNWTLDEITWDYPPMVDMDASDVFELGSVFVGTTSLKYKDGRKFESRDIGSIISLKMRKTAQFMSYEHQIVKNDWSFRSIYLSEDEDWDFQTTGTWNATVSIYKTNQEMTKRGFVYRIGTKLAGDVISVAYPDHGFNTGDYCQFNHAVAGWLNNGTQITVIDKDTFTYAGNPTGAVGITENLEIWNLSQFELVKQYESSGNRNIVTTGKSSNDAAYYKIVVTNYVSNTNGRAVFESRGPFAEIVCRVLSVNGDGEAVVDVTDGGMSVNLTSVSAERSAFGARNGYPRAVTVHDQRLCFSGISTHPQTVWCSAVDDFFNFKKGSNESDALQFSIAASQANRIQWMYSQRKLMLGTSGDEWTIGGADSSTPFSATNVQAIRQSSYGSKYMTAILINDVLLFVQRKGRKVRELVYNLDRDAWVAPDLTVLSEHITAPAIREISYVQQPDAILFAVRDDGVLATMTYERDQNVVAWHRQVTAGKFESVGTIYGATNDDDEVWCIVNRETDGKNRRTIERFDPMWRNAFYSENKDGWKYLDCYMTPVNKWAIEGINSVDGRISIKLNYKTFHMEPAENDRVVIEGVNGMTEINGSYKLVNAPDDAGWILCDPTTGEEIDATGWSAYTHGGTMTFTSVYSAEPLSGRVVTAYNVGGATQQQICDNGRLELDEKPMIVGLAYTSTLRPMSVSIPMQDGISKGRNARIHRIVVSLFRTLGGEFSTDGVDWYPIHSRQAITEEDTHDKIFTGEKEVYTAGEYSFDADIRLRQTKPAPLVVRSIITKLDAYGS